MVRRRLQTSGWLLISLAAHAALCAGLLAVERLAPDPPTEPTAVDLQLVMVDPPQKRRDRPPSQRPSGPPPTEVARVRPRSSSEDRAPAAELEVDRPPAPAPMRLAMRGPDLSIRPRWSAPPVAPSETEAPGARINRKLHKVLRDDQARRNVASGAVDPTLYEVERSAQKAFRPTWALTESDQRKLGTIGQSSRDFLKALGRDYLDALQRYNDANRGLREHDTDPSMLDQYRTMIEAGARRASGLSCVYCVELAFGQPAAITLERSSDRPRFDSLSRQALARASRLHAPRRRAEPVRACYRFDAQFFRVPPLPVAGCNFDESTLSAECFYPTKKILRARVTLVSAIARTGS